MREVRRKDRLLEPEIALQVMKEGEYGFLAMINADGGGYGVPFSYVFDGEDKIYFHCAPEGHKLDNLRVDNRVTFTVVAATEVLPSKFSTLYQSVMAFGKISLVEDEQEKYDALWELSKKYSPAHLDVAEKYIKGSFMRTTVLQMDITGISAKTRR